MPRTVTVRQKRAFSSPAKIESLESRQLLTAAIAFTEFPQIGKNTNFVQHLTAGPDGNVYFSSGLANNIDSISPTGAVKVYDVTQVSPHGPSGIAVGLDGNVYFDDGNNFGVLGLPAGTVSNVPLSNTLNTAGLLTRGPDGNFWADCFFSIIERISPAGQVTDFSYSGSGSGQIVSFNNKLYFNSANFIRTVSTAGAFGQAFPTPSGANVQAIAVGPDGNLWFTEQKTVNNTTTSYYGYLTKTGTMKEFVSPIGPASGIAAGADGNIYFRAADYLVGVNTAGTVVAEQNLGMGNNTDGKELVAGPDGNLWFNESFNDRIGVAYIAGTLSGKVTNSTTGVGIVGVTVYEDVKHTGAFAAGDPTATTIGGGFYSFVLGAGSYTIGVIPPSGSATPASVVATVSVNHSTAVNFAIKPNAVAGAPVVGLVAVDSSAAEGVFGSPSGTGLIVLNRESGSSAAVIISLSVGGTAVNGTDYKISVSGGTFTYNASTKVMTITLVSNAKGAAITVTPLTVATSEPAKTVTLLLATTPLYKLDAAKTSATVTIAAH